MTIREATSGVEIAQAVYNVGFNDGDETQFDVRDFSDLEEMWMDFCKTEGCAPDSVDYVDYVGEWEAEDTTVSKQIVLLRQDGYKSAANMLEDFAKGKPELDYIKNFIASEDFKVPIVRKQLCCLWTAYCLRRNLVPDTAAYDALIFELGHEIGYEVTQDWSDFDSFDFYMGALLS